MKKTPEEYLAEAEAVLDRAEAEGRDLTDDENTAYEELVRGAEAAKERAAKVEAVRAAAADPTRRETGFSGRIGMPSRKSPTRAWDGLGDDIVRYDSGPGLLQRAHDAIEALPEHVPAHGRELLAQTLRNDNESADASAFILAATSPHYEGAFRKFMRDTQFGHLEWTAEERLAWAQVRHSNRASLSDSNASAIVPLVLDPMVLYTNAGAINPIRRIAAHRTTTSQKWSGAVSAGATGTWKSEGSAFTAGDPTISAVTATPEALTTWLTGSYEVFQDTNAAQQIPEWVREAFDRAESAAFVTGAGGTPTPTGVLTAIAAVTASRVSTTTAGVFTTASVADLYNVDNALPARSRAGRPAWIMSRTIMNIIRAMSATANGSSFWAGLGDTLDGINRPARLLDHDVYEASAMATSVSGGTNVLALFDASQVLVVDRLGTVLEYVQNVVDGSGVPTGQRGFIGFKRTTVLVPNTDCGRVLRA